MKKLFPALTARRELLGTSALALLITVLAAAFWFSTSSTSLAGSSCTLCHKRTTTITVVCGSLEYRRHIDHGDTAGMCTGSRTEGDPKETRDR